MPSPHIVSDPWTWTCLQQKVLYYVPNNNVFNIYNPREILLLWDALLTAVIVASNSVFIPGERCTMCSGHYGPHSDCWGDEGIMFLTLS